MEDLHAPLKDQIDDETILFDLDTSMDAGRDMNITSNYDNDSDTQKSQECRMKTDTLLSRVGSFASLNDEVNLEDIYEYEWADSDLDSPKSQKDSYVVQEILADYLKIKSFKRKYSDISRRVMDAYERSWLQQEGIVPIGRVDLGLTALKTEEVMNLLQRDYPDVHVLLVDLFRRRKFAQTAKLQKRQYEAARIERGEARAEAARKRAVQSASDFNHHLVSDRLTKRRCYWDLQTMQIHVPQRVYKYFDSPIHHPNGFYPVALIPGQFAEFYQKYTPEQLFHLPLSRVSFPQPLRKHKAPPPLPTNLRYGHFKSSVPPANENQSFLDDSELRNNEVADNNLTSDSHLSVSNQLSDKTQISNSKSDSMLDKKGVPEAPTCSVCHQLAVNYLRCSECKLTGHSQCLDVPDSMLPGVRSYAWCCMDCKKCMQCQDAGHEDQMMFCDLCDRGYHIFCVGLSRIPDGKWECPLCTTKVVGSFLAKKRRYQRQLKSPNGSDPIIKRPRGRPPNKSRYLVESPIASNLSSIQSPKIGTSPLVSFSASAPNLDLSSSTKD